MAAVLLFGVCWPAVGPDATPSRVPAGDPVDSSGMVASLPIAPPSTIVADANVVPQAKISLVLNGSPARAAAPLSENFSADASAPGAATFSFAWVFGDGSPNQTFVVNASGGSASLRTNHTYSTSGNYTVNVTASDNLRDTDAYGNLVVRVAPAFLVTFNLTPTHPVVGRAVVVTPTASGGISPYHVAWTGVPANCFAGTFNLTCVLAAPGNYSVRATVSDATVDRFSQDVFIVVTPRLFVTAAYQSAFTCVASSGVPVYNFTATTIGGDPPVNYTWTIGNGVGTAYGPAITRTLPLDESFVVTLVAVDAIGEQATSSVSFSTSFPACGAVPPPNYAPPLLLLVGGVVALVGLIAILGVILWRGERDRRRPPPPSLKAAVPAGAQDRSMEGPPRRPEAPPPWNEAPPKDG